MQLVIIVLCVPSLPLRASLGVGASAFGASTSAAK